MSKVSETPSSDLQDPGRRRGMLYAGVALGAGALGVVAATTWKNSGAAGQAGETVNPALWKQKFASAADGNVDLAAFQGVPLVLNFWATWCPPCVDEMPLLEGFYRQNAAKRWQVLGLAIDKASPVKRFIRENGISFTVGLAESGGSELAQLLGNLSGGLPFTVVLGPQGQVVQRKIGRLSKENIVSWSALSWSV